MPPERYNLPVLSKSVPQIELEEAAIHCRRRKVGTGCPKIRPVGPVIGDDDVSTRIPAR